MTDTTEKALQADDISSIYSQFEPTIITVKESIDLKPSLSSLSHHSMISSSSSNSSSNSSVYGDALEENDTTLSACSCRDFLVSKDVDHCRFCNSLVPISQHLQETRSQLKNQMTDMKFRVENHQSTLKSYQRDTNTLEAAYTRRKATLIEMTSKIQSLQQDIEIVQLKHKDEIAHTIEIEHSKKLVQNEMHDLSQRLFEEANNLVLAEKQEKLLIQAQHDQVNDELKNAELQLADVQLELQELRKDMSEKDQEPQQQLNHQNPFLSCISTHENYLLRAQLDMSSLQKDAKSPIQVNTDYYRQVFDTTLLEDFGQFCQDIRSIGLTKMYNLPFMKACLKADIEPCLRFGPNPRLSSKKMMDAILAKTCLIEPCSPSFLEAKLNAISNVEPVKVTTRLWDRFSSSVPSGVHNGCQACGRVLENDCWRFRISYFDEWAIIDRYCYERIASVIEFYSFLRKLKANEYKDIDPFQVYLEYSQLQLQMFLSRLGTRSTLLDEFGLETKQIGYSY